MTKEHGACVRGWGGGVERGANRKGGRKTYRTLNTMAVGGNTGGGAAVSFKYRK